MIPFADRHDAGKQLGELLAKYEFVSLRVVVLGLPRGGVPVAYEVARRLRCAWDVFVVRKLGVPTHPELAMGAIASGGIVVRNEDVIEHLGISEEAFERVRAQQQQVLDASEKLYRSDERAKLVSVKESLCIVVDDGIATGASMRAAVIALRSQNPHTIMIAAPVASPSVREQFADLTDRIYCVHTPSDFTSVGAWYMNFDQTSDEEVASLLYNKHFR